MRTSADKIVLASFGRAVTPVVRRRLAFPSAGRAGLLLVGTAGMLVSGCGYRVAGRGERIPPDVKTIAVPAFTNQTSRYHIEQKLAADITREFIERTKFRVTHEPAGADAVLEGTVENVEVGVVTFDLTTGRATTLEIQVVAGVNLRDRHTRKVIFSNPRYIFREEYQVNPSSSALFEEDEAAVDRISQDMARTLVTDILENF